MRSRAVVTGAAAAALASASRVADGLSRRTGVCLRHHVHEALACAVSGRGGGLASAIDVDVGAALALLDLGGGGGLSETRQEGED